MSYGDYPDLSGVKRVLVVKMRHLGDVLLTSPVFTHLKKTLPEAEIDALIYQESLPMLEGHPAISQFHLYDRGIKKLSFLQRLKRELSLLWQIRKRGYDLVINLTEGDRGAIAAWVSKSRIRVGFDPEGKGFKGKKKIYTHIAKSCRTPRHTVEKQLDVLRRIGIFPPPEERDLLLHVPEAARSAALQKSGLKEGTYLVIHPVSRWRFKCLSPQQMAQLIQELAPAHSIVLTAGPDPHEIAMIEEILQLIPQVPVCNLAGKITLKELAALIQQSRGLICVDSVPLHMASALKTPVVALFGPSSELNWGPWMHPRSRIVAEKTPCRPCHLDGCGGSKRSDCLYRLTTSTIKAALHELLP
jgi:heptosyltransferase-3